MDGQHYELFLTGLQKLEQRAKKCIELRGGCTEYILSLVAVAYFLPGRAKDLLAPPRNELFKHHRFLNCKLVCTLQRTGVISRVV